MASGIIYAACEGGVATLRVCGRAQAHQCPAMRRFAEDVLSGRASEIRIDLSGCEHFDSTFLGTLLHLRRAKCQAGQAQLTLVSPSEACLQILGRMGARSLFRIDAGCCDADTQEWDALPEEEAGCGDLEFKRNVVQAHQELAEVDGPMRDTYRMVAEMAAQDLASAQQR
jgi:anti-anti-sigma factor